MTMRVMNTKGVDGHDDDEDEGEGVDDDEDEGEGVDDGEDDGDEQR